MNETQLHARLSDLAGELAPDADPYAQASGARMLHRRQRRTRAGLAGLAAAIAAVVVGVPVGIGALSAPDGNVATPTTTASTTAPPPPGEASLRQLADALRTALGNEALHAGGDPRAAERPCPDAADLLSAQIGTTVGQTSRLPLPGTTIASGCSYARSWDDNGTERLVLGLSSTPAAEALIVREEEAPEGCVATSPPVPNSEEVSGTHILLCRGEVPSIEGTYPDQMMWRVTVPDSRGAVWVLTALVGSSLPENTGIESIVALRDVVQDELVPPTELDVAAEEMAARIAEMFPNLSVGAPADLSCPAASSIAGFDLEAQPKGPPTGLTYCHWSAGPPDSEQPAPLFGRIQYQEQVTLEAIPCPGAYVSGSSPAPVLHACQDGEFVTWTLSVPATDGTGRWVIAAGGGVEDTPDSSADGPDSLDLLFALVQVADQTW